MFSFGGLYVLCIDNDLVIFQGMVVLFGNWKCDVIVVESLEDVSW